MVLIGDCEDVSKICRKKSYSTFDSTSVHIVLSMYVCVCACIRWVAWPFTCLMVPLTCFSFLSVCEASLLPFIIILFLHVSSVYKSNKFFISFISFFFQSLLTSGLIDHGPLLANLWLWCMTVCPATMGVNIGSMYLPMGSGAVSFQQGKHFLSCCILGKCLKVLSSGSILLVLKEL